MTTILPTAVLPDLGETFVTVVDRSDAGPARDIPGTGTNSHGRPVDSGDSTPVLRVLSGAPTDEEVAALVLALAAIHTSVPEPVDEAPPETWGHPTLMHQRGLAYSPTSFAVSPELGS